MQQFIIVFALLIANIGFSQDPIIHKEIKINRVQNAPKIDGLLNDEAWKNANTATDFVMFKPENGTKEPDNIKTEVKIVYDDEAIYFGAYLHDDKPNEIPMEFETRDRFGNADFFLVAINPSNDGINSSEFAVMSTGNQNDANVTSNGEDWSWNAVWDSKVSLVDDGWIVEIKIPYSALRFKNENVQTWGLNIHRQHRKNRDQYSWNFIDRNKGRITQYDGIITGINNIKPPVRLSVNPYISGSAANFDNENEFIWSAGMDIKYGISENFTLDATLIPDFGQTGFDKIRLNLGPFEQRYSEKRAFFTEGVDLFTKGGFFYSRRIGNAPIGITLADNESIPEYPQKVDMLNAIKVSGRTKGGLGIGVFNAITKRTKATVITTDETTNETSSREEVVEPLANYSVLVLDQQFNKNSSVSFINTNVMREGFFRDANVTGLLFDINNKKNTYGIGGGIAMSNIFEDQNTKTGFEGRFDINKTSGKHRFGIGMDFKDKDYDKNDLGYQRTNNKIQYDAYYSFRILEPYKNFNSFSVNLFTEVKYLLDLDKNTPSFMTKSNLYTGNFTNLRFMATTKKQLTFGGSIKTTLGDQYDYYEPRRLSEGRFYKDTPFLGYSAFMSTDYNNKFAYDISFFRGVKYNGTRNYNEFSFSPRYRFSNRLNLIYTLEYVIANNEKGYIRPSNYETEDIIFGNRDEKNITNSISAKYNFTTKAALNLAFRHNWNPVTYDKNFFILNYDGTLSDSDYNSDPDNFYNHNINFNNWNIDLNFKWEFAPGSELVALYRNQIGNFDDQSQLNFTDNLDNLFQQNQLNSISLKITYYLDYNSAKNWL
jgi:hypothetical protein